MCFETSIRPYRPATVCQVGGGRAVANSSKRRGRCNLSHGQSLCCSYKPNHANVYLRVLANIHACIHVFVCVRVHVRGMLLSMFTFTFMFGILKVQYHEIFKIIFAPNPPGSVHGQNVSATKHISPKRNKAFRQKTYW
jgi:hypothetical protein